MALYQCTVCKTTIQANPERCCASGPKCRDKELYHCGRPMMEIID